MATLIQTRFSIHLLLRVFAIGLLLTAGVIIIAGTLPRGVQIGFVDREDGIYIKLTDVSHRLTVPMTGDGRVNPEVVPAWSRDGRWMAFNQLSGGGFSPSITLVDAVGNTRTLPAPAMQDAITRRFPGVGLVNGNLTWSPDGATIAFAGQGERTWQLYLIDVASGENTRLEATEDAWRPQWSPDGNQIAYRRGATDADVYLVDTTTDESWPLLDLSSTGEAQGTGDMTFSGQLRAFDVWSPDGSRLAVLTRYRNGAINGDAVLIVDVTSGTVERQILIPGEVLLVGVAWSPDGHRLAYSLLLPNSAHMSLVVMDVESGTRLYETHGRTHDWSTAGLLAETIGMTAQTWRLVPSDRLVVLDGERISYPTWRP